MQNTFIEYRLLRKKIQLFGVVSPFKNRGHYMYRAILDSKNAVYTLSLSLSLYIYICVCVCVCVCIYIYEGWNFNSGNYLFTTDTK